MITAASNTEEGLKTALRTLLEQEGIEGCVIHIFYDACTDNYLVRVDHEPSKLTVAHAVNWFQLTQANGLSYQKAVEPIVVRLLEALTS